MIGACANPDTEQGSCTPNVDMTGITQMPDPCDEFAYCDGGAANCCQGFGDGGSDYNACLHGYGDPKCPYLLGGSGNFECSLTAPGDGGTGDGGLTDGG